MIGSPAVEAPVRWWVFACVVGCAEPPPPPEVVPGTIEAVGTPVVVVDGAPVTSEMVAAVVHRLPPPERARVEATGSTDEVVDVLVTTQLLYAQALKAGLQHDPEVELAIALAARDVLAGAMADKVGRDAITEETVAALYTARADRYARPQVKARHIVVSDAVLAMSLRERLDAGEDFAALAKEHSQEKGTRERGGDLGWFEREEMFHEVSDAAFAAEPGELIGPIETRLGFHLVRVEDKRDATPLDEAREELEAEIRDTALTRWIETTRGAAVIGPPPEASSEGAP